MIRLRLAGPLTKSKLMALRLYPQRTRWSKLKKLLDHVALRQSKTKSLRRDECRPRALATASELWSCPTLLGLLLFSAAALAE